MTNQKTALKGIRFRTDIKKWEARIEINKQKLSKTFNILDAALAWRKSQEESKSSECHLTCEQRFPHWIESLKNSGNFGKLTIVKYERSIKTHYHNFFEAIKIKDVDDKLIMDFVIYLNEKCHLCTKTIKDHIGALSNFFEDCCLRGYLTTNPAKTQHLREMMPRYFRQGRKKSSQIREKSRTPDEVYRLIDASFERSYEFGVATEFFFVTGARLGEVASLTWNDIVLQGTEYYCLINKTLNPIDKTISQHAKCNSDGYVPLPPSLIKKLITLKSQSIEGSNLVFPSLHRNQDGFSRALGKLSIEIGIRKTTAHKLRHSFVTHLVTSGVNFQVVRKGARHSKISMTDEYFEASHLGLDKISNTMEDFLSRPVLQPTQPFQMPNLRLIPVEKLG